MVALHTRFFIFVEIAPMKTIKRIFVSLLILIVVAVAALLLSGNDHILRGLPSTYLSGNSRPDIDDLKHVETRVIKSGQVMEIDEDLLPSDALPSEDLDYLKQLRSAAFLVMHCDTLVYEFYGEGFNAESHINSFSMAKSFTSMCFGAAVDHGLVSYDDPVSSVLPRFSEGENAGLTMRHLLQMRSNIDFGESYANPFGYQAKAYYGTDLWGITAPYRVDDGAKPGTEWKYEGGNTVVLSEVLAKVTGQSLSEWFSEQIWQPMGAEDDAFWNVDREDGHERAFSAVYARPRDFLRLGGLMLAHGSIGETEVLSTDYVEAAIKPVSVPDPAGEVVEHYGLHWWLAPPNYTPWHFSARGMRGQYIIVLPDHDLVVVRMGHERDERKTDAQMTGDLPKWVEMGMKLREAHVKGY